MKNAKRKNGVMDAIKKGFQRYKDEDGGFDDDLSAYSSGFADGLRYAQKKQKGNQVGQTAKDH